MKMKQVTGLIMALGLLLPLSAMAEDDDNDGYGRIPPGVQLYPGGVEGGKMSMFANIYYTNDTPDKVMDFYRRTLGMEPVEKRTFYLGENDVPGVTDGNGPVNLRINTASEREGFTYSEKTLFGSLEEALKNPMFKTDFTERDVQEVKHRFAHLSKAWYPTINKKKVDRVCNERGEALAKQQGDVRSQGEMDAKRIQELVAQGRGQEATALVHQSAGRGANFQSDAMSVHLADRVRCLEEYDKYDYQVEIFIGKASDFFTPASAEGGSRGGKGSASKSSGITDQLKDKGMGKLKGMFGF